MSENGQPAVETPVEYSGILLTISAREQAAEVRATHWREAFMLVACVAAGLTVGLVLSIQTSQTKFVRVQATEEGPVRLFPLTHRPWTVSEIEIRNELKRWLFRVRPFGTDDRDIARQRLLAWNQAYQPAQRWLKEQFTVLPLTLVGKEARRLVDFSPGVPDIRLVPPTTGRTWEVYWQEDWQTVQRATTQRKAFQAFVIVRIKEPSSDAEADHLGVFIEDITVQERPSAQATIPESPARGEQPAGGLRVSEPSAR